MSNKVTSKLLPLLNTFGILVLFSPILFVLLGFFGIFSFNLSIIFLVISYVLLTIYFFISYLHVKSFLNNLLFDISLSPSVTAMKESALEIYISLSSEYPNTNNFKLFLRPEIEPAYILNPSKEELIFPLDFSSKDLNNREVRKSFKFSPLGRNDIIYQNFWLRISPKNFIFKKGLLTWQVNCALSEKKLTKVFPNPFLPEDLSSAKNLNQIGSKRLLKKFSDGREFESLKKYQRDDHVRHIDWKRSAKHNKLLVKKYSPETNQRILIALDCSRKMKSPVKERSQLDFAVDAAASLSSLALNFEDELGFLAFSHKLDSSVLPAKSSSQQKLVMEKLRNVSASPYDSNYKVFSSWANKQRKRSLLVLITSVISPSNLTELREGLRQINKKHILLLAICKSQAIDEVLNQKVSNLEEAYTQAAAFKSRSDIENRLDYFQSSGINCIYANPSDVARKLREKYIEFKQAGII